MTASKAVTLFIYGDDDKDRNTVFFDREISREYLRSFIDLPRDFRPGEHFVNRIGPDRMEVDTYKKYDVAFAIPGGRRVSLSFYADTNSFFFEANPVVWNDRDGEFQTQIVNKFVNKYAPWLFSYAERSE